MQYASALALSSLSGKAPTKESITAILNATGKKVDAAQVDAVLKSLNNRKVEDVISKGLSKVSVGSSAPQTQKEAPKKEEKKVEKKAVPKKAEPEPEPEDENFGDLFG